jgi:S1-C subfamily serine protease
VIVAVAGNPTPTLEALATVLAREKPGDKVKVKVAGGGTKTITLGELPG